MPLKEHVELKKALKKAETKKNIVLSILPKIARKAKNSHFENCKKNKKFFIFLSCYTS